MLASFSSLSTQIWVENNQRLVFQKPPLFTNLLTVEHSIADTSLKVIVQETKTSMRQQYRQFLQQITLISVILLMFSLSTLILLSTSLVQRIRTLHKNIQHAIHHQQTTLLPEDKHQDEISDLTQSYTELQTRVQSYTQYLENLSRTLSHELRTPYSIVKSSLENMQLNPEKSNLYLQRANQGLQSLGYILNSLSAARSLEQSIQDTDTETIDINALLDELIPSYQDSYQHPIHFTHNKNPLWIQASADLWVQMLDKLVANAVDFSLPKAPIEISLSADTETLVLSVFNQGENIPESQQDNLFNAMTSKRKKQSSEPHLGLGLYIVQLIVKFHQGSIYILNSVDGVKFEMRFSAILIGE